MRDLAILRVLLDETRELIPRRVGVILPPLRLEERRLARQDRCADGRTTAETLIEERVPLRARIERLLVFGDRRTAQTLVSENIVELLIVLGRAPREGMRQHDLRLEQAGIRPKAEFLEHR